MIDEYAKHCTHGRSEDVDPEKLEISSRPAADKHCAVCWGRCRVRHSGFGCEGRCPSCVSSPLLPLFPLGHSGLTGLKTLVRTQVCRVHAVGQRLAATCRHSERRSLTRTKQWRPSDSLSSLLALLTYVPTYTQRTPRKSLESTLGLYLLRKRIAGKPLARVHRSGRRSELQKRSCSVEQHGFAARYASRFGTEERRNATLDRPQICSPPFLRTLGRVA